MNHYTYEIEFENGMKYIGVRSCRCLPEKDTSYLGSSKVIPPELYVTCVKRILSVFDTRIEALREEIRLHEELDIAVNPNYYNQVKQTSTLFDQAGTTKESHAHIRAMAEKLKGRTKEDYQYLQDKSRTSAKYRGKARTEAQKLADEKMRGVSTGKNPKKGNSGTSSPKYRPWYYITPAGVYTEVYTTVRNFVLNENKLPKEATYNSIGRAVCELAHTPLLRGSLRGYVFGYLDNKPEYLTQENIQIALQVATHLILPEVHQQRQKVFKEGYNPISNITAKSNDLSEQ